MDDADRLVQEAKVQKKRALEAELNAIEARQKQNAAESHRDSAELERVRREIREAS